MQQFFSRIKKRNPETELLIEMFGKIAQAFANVPRLGARWGGYWAEGSAPKPSENAPALPFEEWELSRLQLAEGCLAIKDELRSILEGKEAELEALLSALEKDKTLAVELVTPMQAADLKTLEAVCKKHKLDADITTMVFNQILQERGHELKDLLDTENGKTDKDWVHPTCPVCGSAANFSFLSGEGGQRSLVCSLCGEQWRYQRTACAFCGIDTADSSANMTIFYLDDKDGKQSDERAEACTSCKKYILAADLRQRQEDIPYAHLMPFSLIYLDLMMAEQGYTPGNMAG